MSKTNDNITKDKKGKTTMELNRLSVSIISVLVTLAIAFGGFAYQTGSYNNEIKNIKNQQKIIKSDLKEDIENVIDIKADKVVVEMLIKRLDESIKENKNQHKIILEKLDKIIEKEYGDK